MAESVGFIGLGIMGRPMAKNLLAAGFPLTVFNRTRAKMAELVSLGAQAAASPRAVAEQSDVVITMVSDSPDVHEVVLGPNGIIEGAHPGMLLIDMSTISPAVTREIAARLADRGCAMLDAPVSGGERGAIEGTLSIMAGGAAEDVARAQPVFAAMGRTVTHVGPSGAGQVCKLANQIAVGLHNLAISEALVFAAKAGVDPAKVQQAISAGAGGSWAFANLAPKILRRDFSPGFMVKLQQKDLRLVLDAAREMMLPLPATALTFQMYEAILNRGWEAEGNHAVVKALEILAGVEVRGEQSAP